VEADGNVRIDSSGLLWVGEHIKYNFKTKVMTSEEFRTGRIPFFAGGTNLTGNITNKVYVAQGAYVTTDDNAEPAYVVRAKAVKIIPGQKVQMWNAVAYVEGVPVFYFPYYERSIKPRSNHFTITPGYRSRYGAYLLNTYNWYLGDVADGRIHADIRTKRGPGVGPDVGLHMGQWGEANFKYYYQYDRDPNYSTNVFPQFGNIPNNRQRFYMDWQATPATNLNLKALVNYQSDPLFLRDFFESAYTMNPQPNTFVEANKYWENWSLDALTTPKINNFFSQIERLPDVKLTGFRQQVLDTPVYYDSESSLGYYRSWAANATNGLYPGTNGFYWYKAGRGDTFHQLTLPMTFFNWLNITPRAGGRLTYYSSQYTTGLTPTNAISDSDVVRGVFNTGVEVSFKASQLWADATNSLLAVNGLRHIIEPSANYVFVPDPSVPPAQLPQFDSALPSLMLLPVNFPDYNSIDSIDTQNVIRFGLRNILQTKRDSQLEDLVNWNLLLDWRLNPKPGEDSLNDLYSAFSFRPRTWLTFESQTRYDIQGGHLNLTFDQVTFAPNDRWSWGLSYWYLRSGFISPVENNFITSTFYFRVDDNWGLRAAHTFNAETGTLQEQAYTIFRDMRSWTAAITFRAQANSGIPTDFTVAFSLSLKAVPSLHVGEDALSPYHLVGE
jgi:lipopolysaccharide assembly outer membrane protein LptD (OstA)